MRRTVLYLFLLIIAAGIVFLCFKILYNPSAPKGEIGVTAEKVDELEIEVVVDNLQIPWEIAFLPTGEMLVTERPGNLLKIDKDKHVIKIAGVEHTGEGGLQGLAVHPDFENNNYIYLYLTTRSTNGLINRVERYKLIGETLSDKKIIIDNLPGARFHDGGRIEFGPDENLYITTGDAGARDKAQELDYLGGKILRLDENGLIPNDNPFRSAVYSYGHRNPQGLAWDDEDNLWITEHGRSVPLSGFDELNLIKPGENFGWPIIQGDETKDDMQAPIVHSGSSSTWAPAGAIFLKGDIFFTGLRGEAVYQYNIKSKKFVTHFFKDFGRLRAIVIGPEGDIYVSTSNTDGRGDIRENDDKIIKISQKIFTR